MELFDVNLEELQDGCLAQLERHMPDALSVVAAYYQQRGKPLELLPIVQYKSGQVPEDMVPKVFQDFPVVTVEAVSADAGEQEHTMSVELLITFWILAQDTEVVDRLNHRYALAAASVLTEYPPPRVDEVQTPRLLIGSTHALRHPNLLKGSQLTIPVVVTGNV